MGDIVHQYACGHEITFPVHPMSKAAYKDYPSTTNFRQLETSPPKKGFFSKLFRSAYTSQARAPREIKRRYMTIDDICEDCKTKDSLKQPLQGAPWDLSEVRAQQMEKARRAVQEGKTFFRCSRCLREDRPIVYDAERAANEGLCCAHGMKSWQDLQELLRTGRSSKVPGDIPDPADLHPVRSSTAAAGTQAADQRRNRDGSDRMRITGIGFNPERAGFRPNNHEPVHLHPRHEGVPGIAHPTQTTEQGTYYEEPLIDFERLENHHRTNHGLLPLTPQNPLPPPPPYQKNIRGRESSSHRKPVSQPVSRPQPRTPPQTQFRGSTSGAPAKGTRGLARSQTSHETPSRHTFRDGATRPPRPRPELHAPRPRPGLHALAQLFTGPQSLSTPPHPLRSTRGKEWRDAVDLASRSPATPDAQFAISTPHASTRPSTQGSADIGSTPLTSISPSPTPNRGGSDDDATWWLGRKETRMIRSHTNQPNPRETRPSTQSHRLSRPFEQAHPMQDPPLIDIDTDMASVSLISPLTSTPPLPSPVSPPHASRFFLDDPATHPRSSMRANEYPSARTTPLSVGNYRGRDYLIASGRLPTILARDDPPPRLSQAFADTFDAAEYWGEEVRGRPRERRR